MESVSAEKCRKVSIILLLTGIMSRIMYNEIINIIDYVRIFCYNLSIEN